MIHLQTIQLSGLQGLYSYAPIKATSEQEKKELAGNDYLKLYGALAIIEENNSELLQDYFESGYRMTEHASMQDSELYLNDFEGYYINDRYCIRSLYLNKYDGVVMSIWDNKKERYMDFIA